MKALNSFEFVTGKWVAENSNVSLRTAYEILKDIKVEYDVQKVTYYLYCKYFGVENLCRIQQN